MGIHKNYLERHIWSHQELFKKYIFPVKSKIFWILAEKILHDAIKDWYNDKPQLENLGKQVSNYCKQLHEMFENESMLSQENILQEKVNDIIDIDYWTVSDVFREWWRIFDEYGFQEAGLKMQEIANIFATMWKISARHTTIKQREE